MGRLVRPVQGKEPTIKSPSAMPCCITGLLALLAHLPAGSQTSNDQVFKHICILAGGLLSPCRTDAVQIHHVRGICSNQDVAGHKQRWLYTTAEKHRLLQGELWATLLCATQGWSQCILRRSLHLLALLHETKRKHAGIVLCRLEQPLALLQPLWRAL